MTITFDLFVSFYCVLRLFVNNYTYVETSLAIREQKYRKLNAYSSSS
jgi:hypothetical protein